MSERNKKDFVLNPHSFIYGKNFSFLISENNDVCVMREWTEKKIRTNRKKSIFREMRNDALCVELQQNARDRERKKIAGEQVRN